MNLKFVLYDWGGLNAAIFQAINMGTPESFDLLALIFGYMGSYWTAPIAMVALWIWHRAAIDGRRADAIRSQLIRFGVALVLALIMTTLLKLLLDFPRPSAVFGDAVHVVGEAEDHYSLPSGHATYAALIIGTLWPLSGLRLRSVLVLYMILVGWSRIAAGMHFPADIMAGWSLGLGCLAAASRLHIARSPNDNR